MQLLHSKAQGTIEYLVIIAIVIVLALVVVALLSTETSLSIAQISSDGQKLSNGIQVIGITESLVDPVDGNFVVKLLNNSESLLTISNVQVGDVNANFSEDLVQGNSRLFQVNAQRECEQGHVVSANVIITYVSENGVSHTMRYPSQVMFDCTPYVIEQANLANQCPVVQNSCTYTATAVPSDVFSQKTFYSNSQTPLVGSYVPPMKYANYGTGQTSCWDSEGNERGCGLTGEDAAIHGSSFVHVWRDNGNGTLSDLNSGLMWQQDNYGGAITWQDALDYCNNLNLGGYTDWFLPNSLEIGNMYDYQNGSCYAGFINCNNSWSSTSVAASPYYAYYLVGGNGNILSIYKTYNFGTFARCVRFETS